MPIDTNEPTSPPLTLRPAASSSEGGESGIGHDPRFHSLYRELRAMASARLRRHETFTLLDTTALVHESFLRLARAGGVRSADEPAFLAYASHVMRSVIVDTARARLAQRRNAGAELLPLEDEMADVLSDGPADMVVQVHDALQALESSEPRLAQVVAMCYFAGMTEQEAAAGLGVSERTIRRDAERARLLLRALLT